MAKRITDLDQAAASSSASTPPAAVSPAAASSISDTASPCATVQTPHHAHVQDVLISRPRAASQHPAADLAASVSLRHAPDSLIPASRSQIYPATSTSPAVPYAAAFSHAAASSISDAASPRATVQTPHHAHVQELEDGEDEILLTAIHDYERAHNPQNFKKNTQEKNSSCKKRKLSINQEKSKKNKKNN